MRQLLEGAAAELAALNLTETQLAGLAEVADSLVEPTVDWIERSLAFDCQLHDTIAVASGRERLAQDIARYRLLVRGLCRMSGSERNLRAALAEHRAIVEALANRDPLGAKAAMDHHIACRQAAVLAEMTEDVG
jgi:DNA-binding GntR family transcriptional regulator